MPKLPTYDLQARGGGTGPTTPDFINLSTPWANEVSHIGAIVTARSEQMLQEYDAAKAYEAYNSLSDRSRGKMVELLSRESGNAMGIQTDFDEWERKTRGDIEKEIITAPIQQKMFSQLADRHRDSTLNSLATHEAQQTKLYKVEQLKGFADTVDRDMRNFAFDESAAETRMAEFEQAGERMFPGHDRMADNAAAREVFRVSQARELIDKNPKYAQQWIEIPKVKTELGDKYDQIKKMLAAKADDDILTQAMNQAQIRFGTNYAAAAHYFEQAGKFGEWGGDFKKSRELSSYFMTMQERRQHQEDRAYTLSNRAQDQNFMQAWVTYKTAVPGQPVPDFYQMARDGRINLAQLNLYTASLKDSKSDDVTAYNYLYSRIARGENTPELKAEIMGSPLISDPTKIHFLKAIEDDGIKQAFHDIDHVTNAGQTDPSPDRLLKGYEMREKLRGRLERGEDPRKAKDAVINEYTIDLRRTKASLPQTTTHLMELGGKSNDPYAIEKAMKAAADTLVKKQSQAKTARELQQAQEEYQSEFEDLKKLRNLARDFNLVDEVQEQKRIDERKANEKSGGGSRRPGSNY